MLVVPDGQPIRAVMGGGQQQMSAEATAPPALASPTLEPTDALPEPTNTTGDTQGPTISNMVADPNPAYPGTTSAIAADVDDPSGVASVQVRWKHQDATSWRETLTMMAIRKGGTRYTGAIPSSGGFPKLGTVVSEVTGTISVVIP